MRRRARGYTLVELAVAAFATLLMITAMVRWTFDVASTTQQVLTGRDDLAVQAASLLLERDLAAATFCGEPQLTSRIAALEGSRLIIPASQDADGLWRVEWRLHGSPLRSLQRVAVPVVQPGSGAGVSCRTATAPLPGSYEWGTFLSGLDGGSGFVMLSDGAAVEPGLCVYESDSGCSSQVLQLRLFSDGELRLQRSFLLPAAR